MKMGNFSVNSDAFRIALIYFMLSIVWIMFSDQVLEYSFASQQLINKYQTVKGLAFVGITTFVIFMLVRASQRKLEQAHDVIEESERRYRLLVDESPFIIGLIQDSHIVYANPAACELLETDQEELVGKSIDKVLHPDDLDEVKGRVKRLLEGETGLYPAQEKYVSSTGKVIPVEAQATAFTYQGGKAIQVIAMDITNRVTREEILERTLKEKNVLLSEIHHRVKNNLAIIFALIQLQAFQEEDSRTSEVLLMSLRRISSISLIHEHIYQSKDLTSIRFDKIIKELVTLDSKNFDQTSIKKEFELSPVHINVNQAVPCALFLNEAINFIHSNIVSSLEDCVLTIYLKEEHNTCIISLVLKRIGDTSIAVEKSNNDLSFQLIELIGQQLKGEVMTEADNELRISLAFDPDETIDGP